MASQFIGALVHLIQAKSQRIIQNIKKPTIGFSSYRENELYGYDTLDRGNDDLWIAEGI